MENYFVLPFTVGTVILFSILLVKYALWISKLSKIDKLRIVQSIFSRRTLSAIKECFMECLIHRRIFKRNILLGYMHMSLAFGWFLLIVVGHIEWVVYSGTFVTYPWNSIFFQYFVHESFPGEKIMANIMDFLLLFVLSGVLLAYFKRINSRMYGIKKTTKLKPRDRMTMCALWLIFPLRLLAEGATASFYHNGGFLTNSVGRFFEWIQISHTTEEILWWSYSISLGVFFVGLPWSRYMHIFTEVLLIGIRSTGVKLKKEFNSYSRIQVYSCSRCGICIDVCQMHISNISNNQSVYILKNIRDQNLTDRKLFNCLLCGRCEQACPVNINLNDLRISQRIRATKEYNSDYAFLKTLPVEQPVEDKTPEVIYFAGCMTHMTPGIKKSVLKVLEKANVNYQFMDKDKGACCGRPLMLAGQYEAAKKLIAHNREKILESGASTLLVSCPICYKVFKDDYELGQISIKHHSEYFLELVEQGKITLKKSDKSIVYHDPCELGRGCGVYEPPRNLLKMTGNLQSIQQEKVNSLCCSGSLGDLCLSMSDRNTIKAETLKVLLNQNPDMLATACPLCKKTFVKGVDIQVKDIAEIVAESMEN
ncbi:MAG: (Fe-S)-binding protein [Bacteroidales bacterium]|nr:(Fe-S)-binding protein [Bacteroidales bacterium]